MKNLVRGGVILSLISMFVVLIYAQAKTEGVLSSANDSQLQLNNHIEISELVSEAVADDKKLVKKTVSEARVGSAGAAAARLSTRR